MMNLYQVIMDFDSGNWKISTMWIHEFAQIHHFVKSLKVRELDSVEVQQCEISHFKEWQIS